MQRAKPDGLTYEIHLEISVGKMLDMDRIQGFSVSFSTGSRDGAVLQLLLAGAEGAGIRWVLQSKVPSQDHVGVGPQACGWMCNFLQDGKV